MKSYFYGALFVAFWALLAAQNAPGPIAVEDEPHHQVVLKNDSVLVMKTLIPEGESTLYHTHSHDRVSIALTVSTIAFQELGGQEAPPAPTKPGTVSSITLVNGPYAHRVHNLGPGPFEVMDVELLQRPTQPSAWVAAPLAAENPSARVYKWILAPGATSAMHTHERPYLIVAATTVQLKMTSPDGKSMAHEIKPGDFHWVDSKVTHSLANEGAGEGQIIEIELK